MSSSSKQFRCLNCGKCCSLQSVQINLSIGDISRLSQSLKKSVEDLFNEEIIGFMPFFDTETNDAYDVEIGLIKPCRLHIAHRCSAYYGRPLNCRIFPYFLIARFPKDLLKKIFNPEYECVHSIDLSDDEKEKYKKYSAEIGEIILSEAKATEGMMNDIGFKKRLLIIDYRDELKKEFSGKNLSEEEAEGIRLGFFIKEIERMDLKPHISKISEYSKKLGGASIQELEEIEKILQ